MEREKKPVLWMILAVLTAGILGLAGCAEDSLFQDDTITVPVLVPVGQNSSLAFHLRPASKGGIDWGNIVQINLKMTDPNGWVQQAVLTNGGSESVTFQTVVVGLHLLELLEITTNLVGTANTNTNAARINVRGGYNYLVWITVGSTNIDVSTNTNTNTGLTFGLFSEVVPISVLWDNDTRLDIWNDAEDLVPLTLSITEQSASTGAGTHEWKLNGLSDTIFWAGLGIRVDPLTNYRDLRQFTNGSLNFLFRGTRPFKIGLKDGHGTEQWMRPIRMSHYGLRTNDTWCSVSIPLSYFSNIDLSHVQQYFMWFTDPTMGYTSNRTYYLDEIYYSDTFSGTADGYVETNWGLYSETVENTVNFGNDTELAIWNNYATLTNDPVDPGDGPRSWKFTGTGPWMGFGLYVFPSGSTRNMSAYANGHLHFMYRANKAILKLGIESLGGKQAWIMNNALVQSYGLVTNGSWCSVSIPIRAFTSQGVGLDISKLTEYFMWAQDSTSGYAVGDIVHFDNIYWSKD